MKLIKQRNQNDCMLAAIAMVLGKSYDDLWKPEFVERVVAEHGCNDKLTTEALKIAGLTAKADYWQIDLWERLDRDARRLLLGRRAILSVPSLNYQHGYHAVAWDGLVVFDPSQGQVYQWLEQLQISQAYIFNEKPREASKSALSSLVDANPHY